MKLSVGKTTIFRGIQPASRKTQKSKGFFPCLPVVNGELGFLYLQKDVFIQYLANEYDK
jgi:hypothetical protein